MHVPLLPLVIAAFTASLAWPVAIRAPSNGRQAARGTVGLILGATPLFVGYSAVDALITLSGDTLKT